MGPLAVDGFESVANAFGCSGQTPSLRILTMANLFLPQLVAGKHRKLVAAATVFGINEGGCSQACTLVHVEMN